STLPMKSLLALTLVVSAAIAASVPRHALTPNYYDHLEAETPVHRVKREVGGYKSPCPTGWTGQFCESPLCDGKQKTLDPVETDLDKTQDIIYLPAECTGEYYVPVDSTTSMLTITVTTDAQTRAVAVLTNPNGATPNPISTEPSGNSVIYRFRPSPDPYVLTFTVNAHTEECLVHIQARSTLSFDIGWVPAPQIDVSPYGESLYDSKLQYFIAHPFNLASPSQVKTATIRQLRNLQPEYRSTFARRYNCIFEYYAGQYKCTSGSNYIQQIEGVDNKGYAFRRSRTFTCLADAVPTVIPPTTVPVDSCQNGGSLLYNNETDTNFCFCSELTAGKNCEQLLCMNGGILKDGRIDECDCLPGFVGRNCENVVCDPDVGKLLTDTKTLAVVIRNSQSMAVHIPNIMKAIDEEFLHHMRDGRTVYDGFILSYERNGVVTAKSYKIDQYGQFGGDVEALATRYSSDVACTDSLVPAIEAVYAQRIMDQSPIFVFTDASPEPTDTDLFKDVMRLNAANRMQIHTVFMKTQANCKQNPNIKFFNDLARYTAGLVHMPSAEQLEQTFQNAMRATTYKMNLVESADLKQCAMKTKSLIVDYNSENLILIATGKNLRITVTDPDWNTQMKMPFYDDGWTHFFIIANPQGGEYLYAIQGDESEDFAAPCSYRFYSQSDFDLFLGTTSSVDIDERTFEPVVGQAAHLIAQVNGFYGGYVQDQFRLFSEILITSPDNDDKHQPLYYSNGIFRSSCGFHLYFGVANFCQTEDQIFYATVFVDDNNGFPVQRSAVGYCNAGENPPDPEGDACQNGGVRVNETTCWCPSHFSGPTCLNPQCLNGGRPSEDYTTCICPDGVSGTFCEMMECTTKADTWEATTEHRTLSFVVSTRSSMKDVVKQLADGASSFAGYYGLNHPTWIDHFSIVTVNQTGADLHLTNSPQEFASKFREISDNFDSYTNYDEDNCTVLINSGINSALAASYENSYIFVFADSQAEYFEFPDMLKLLDRADELHSTVTLIGTSTAMCDGSGNFGDQEQNVVAFTGGKTLFTEDVSRVFDYIDTFYSSGVVFEASYDNCNTGVQIDFPLEASAHSVIVTVEGRTSTTQMTPPDEQVGLYHDPIFGGNTFTVEQYIQACPDQWDTTDNMCYYYDVNEVQWMTSLVVCGNMDPNKGSSLVTIFDDKKHDQVLAELHGSLIGVWLALFRDSATGQWNWMQAGVPPVPMDASLEKYWAPGQNFADLSKQYVYMKNDGLWYIDDVTGRHWIMCQRDRYGRSYNPESSEPDLPPGFWHLGVTSSSPSCSVQVRVQSDIQVFFGFSQDQHIDFKKGTANVDSKNNYVVAKAVGLDGFEVNANIPEGRIDYATIAADGNDLFPLAMTERAESCTFSSVSKIPFKCPTQQALSEIVVKFQGIDQFGYAFERALVSRCDNYVTRCQNGGTLANGECTCAPHYTGDDCSVPICENGGTSLFDGTCRCPALFTGDFCSTSA
ncbi:hypothetical protein PFISCL1PPCAC_27787, partial [Pristionchus fissidentatus]